MDITPTLHHIHHIESVSPIHMTCCVFVRSVAVLEKYDKFRIGSIAGTKAVYPPWPAVGSMVNVPFAESNFWQGFKSAYMNPSHIAFRKAVRTFLETEIFPDGKLAS